MGNDPIMGNDPKTYGEFGINRPWEMIRINWEMGNEPMGNDAKNN